MFANEERRLTAIARALALSTLCCLVASWKLWLSRPLYPLVPVWEYFPALPRPLDRAVFAVLCGLLLGLVVRPRSRVLTGMVVVLLAALFLQDQNRLWPSFYQFFILLLLLASYRTDTEGEARRVVMGMRFVLAAIYFWSGAHKLNPHFLDTEFPWFIEPLIGLVGFEPRPLPGLGLTAAIAEMLMGIGLPTRRLRNFALVEAMLMHGLILFCIGPWRGQWNSGAWTWSATYAVQAWTLFFRAPPFRWEAMFAAPAKHNVPQVLALVLVGTAPLLNGFNRWDSALSFNVYTGNVDYAEVHMSAGAAAALPEEISRLLTPRGRQRVLVINAWARSEFQANAYPETRVYLKILETLCAHAPAHAFELWIREKAGWFFPKALRRHRCGEAWGDAR